MTAHTERKITDCRGEGEEGAWWVRGRVWCVSRGGAGVSHLWGRIGPSIRMHPSCPRMWGAWSGVWGAWYLLLVAGWQGHSTHTHTHTHTHTYHRSMTHFCVLRLMHHGGWRVYEWKHVQLRIREGGGRLGGGNENVCLCVCVWRSNAWMPQGTARKKGEAA